MENLFKEFDETLNHYRILVEEKFDPEEMSQFQQAFGLLLKQEIVTQKCRINTSKKIMNLVIQIDRILKYLPTCLNSLKELSGVYLKIEKTLKTHMDDNSVYWEYDSFSLSPDMWLIEGEDECQLSKPLVEILLNQHTVTDDARYGYHQCVEYKDGQPFKVYQKKAEKSDGEYLKVPINNDGFYDVYCHAINIAWQKYLKYQKDISSLFYNRRGWRVIAKEEGKFKLVREEYSWDIEEVLIDFTQDNPYDVWKGKTADPLDVKNEIDYQLEIFGWKGYAEKFQLPAIWEFGNPKTMEFYQYTPQKWADVFFKLAMIQSWLYISENHMYYRADHIFDM